MLLVIFSVLRPDTFTNSFNFANLLIQSAPVIVIAMGLVFVLLLGEIDLSAGYTAGVAGAVLGVVSTKHDKPWYLGVLACLATGAVIGLVIGLLVARVGIPSFVVTLAAFLALQGLLLKIIGEGGTIRIQSETVLAIMAKNLPVWLGWTMFVVLMLVYAAVTYRGLADPPGPRAGDDLDLRVAGQDRHDGRPARHLHLLPEPGAQPEPGGQLDQGRAHRDPGRAGAAWCCSPCCSTAPSSAGTSTRSAATPRQPAGPASTCRGSSCSASSSARPSRRSPGVLLASRVNSVTPTTGGGETLLYAVGAAVIGGTSLFGGKGRPVDAVIGGLVVAVVANGMGLLDQSAAVVYMVTGGVLLLAAGVDALSRRRAMASGRG